MGRADIIEILKSHGLSPNKRLGQNFLTSDALAEKICEASGLDPTDRVLEVGPGLGVLTGRLASRSGSVVAVEIDSGLARFLRESFSNALNVEIIHGDILRIEPDGRFTKSVSNLPYYCATEILFHMAIRLGIPDLFVMLQREMAHRIIASQGSREYGALTVTLGMYYRPRLLFNAGRSVFHPSPEVSSSFIALRRREDVRLSAPQAELFHGLVKSAFWGRRKTLVTALTRSPHLTVDKKVVVGLLEELKHDVAIRGEELSVDEFIMLAKGIYRRLNE